MRASFAWLLVLLAGCVGNSNVPPVQYYVLGNPEESAFARRASQTSGLLLVNPTVVSPFYDTQRLVYSRAEGQRAYYQFAAWTDRPGRSFSELLIRRLGASTTSGVKGGLVLHTRLHELYHDASVSPGTVKMQVSAELVDPAGRLMGERRHFSRVVHTRSENAAGAVEAANRAVSDVVEEIAAWVQQAPLGAEPRVESAGERPDIADTAALK